LLNAKVTDIKKKICSSLTFSIFNVNFVDYCHDSAKQASLMALAAPRVQSSMVNGQWSMVNVQWSMVNVQWSMFNGQWSMVNGQWSMVNVQS
jgi:hypothetical protein